MTEALYYVAATPFEAARHVSILSEGHRSRRLHGHGFLARVRALLADEWGGFPGAEAYALADRLRKAVIPLDYTLLNDQLDVPTDENLARWVRLGLDIPGIESVGIQSTRNQGVDVDSKDHAHIWRRFRFEAAHQLPNVPKGHKCGRMHGHGFEAILHADQDLGSRDMGIDFDHLEHCWAPLELQLHYSCLNKIPGLENPTSEMLAGWIWQRLKDDLPGLSWVTVYETATAGCHYDGDTYRIWKEQSLEGALRLLRAPKTSQQSRLHGHSYLARLHLSAPLDEVMGWTIDYGDVKELFHPIYRQLDHHHLNELDGIKDADIGSLLYWVQERAIDRLPQLDRIDLYETPECGAILCWGERRPALPA